MRSRVCASLLAGCLVLGCSGSSQEKQEAGLDLVQIADRADEALGLPKPMPAEEAVAYADLADRFNAGVRLEPGSLDKVIGINFYGCDLRRADLAVLKNFPGLQELDLGKNSRISDAHLEHLEGLTALRWLSLREDRVTGGGLAHLLPLTKLKYLNVTDTYMQDPALLYVARFKELETLVLLSNPGITDAGLMHLKALTSLTSLDVRGTKVTDAGKQELSKALPKLKFE